LVAAAALLAAARARLLPDPYLHGRVNEQALTASQAQYRAEPKGPGSSRSVNQVPCRGQRYRRLRKPRSSSAIGHFLDFLDFLPI
jgi:hypothetical protein